MSAALKRVVVTRRLPAQVMALLADRTAYRVVEAETARRSRTHAEVGSGMVGGMVAPAYGPDVS